MLAPLALLLVSGKAEITVPPEPLRKGWYSKQLLFEGMPILASDKVEDQALLVVREHFTNMLQNVPRAWVAQLAKRRVQFAIIAEEEQTTDLPEYRYLKKDRKVNWDERARGFGGPTASGAEENILEYTTDRYRGASILIHEFSHTLHTEVFSPMDPRFDRDLAAAYKAAVAEGLWKNTYGGTNAIEYWANGVQCYFDANYLASPPNGYHNEICDRQGLQRYDPRLFRLIDRAFDRNPWRYPGAYNKTGVGEAQIRGDLRRVEQALAGQRRSR